MRRHGRRGAFTLVELLVVIGIIAILISILLPSLARAREQAATIKCAAHLRSVGQGMEIYAAENKSAFPAAYVYNGQQVSGNAQTPAAAVNGYYHWSAFIYNAGGGSRRGGTALEAFTCPSIERGGLPPTNTTEANRDAGQSNDNGGVVDEQAPRCAFTVNEAICPRNKWVRGFQGAQRVYRYVKIGSVKNTSNVILATEWHQNWRIVSDAGRSSEGTSVCKSHRPIHGFVPLSGDPRDMAGLPRDAFGGRPSYRRARIQDLNGDPQPGSSITTVLDWVGRNHGRRRLEDGFDVRKTNFLYVDGHVETKSIRDTLFPLFQWGERFYSLQPGDDMAPDDERPYP